MVERKPSSYPSEILRSGSSDAWNDEREKHTDDHGRRCPLVILLPRPATCCSWPGRAGWLRRAACDTIVNSTSVNRKRSKKDHRVGDRMRSGRRQTTEPGEEQHEPEGTRSGPP